MRPVETGRLVFGQRQILRLQSLFWSPLGLWHPRRRSPHPLTGPPPRLGEHRPVPGQPLVAWQRAGELLRFTIPFNVTGQPAISLPLHWSDDGLPIGVQLVAAFGREDLLSRVAAQLEVDGAWRGRRPPIHA